jgi:hypothetical protein
LEPSGQHNHVNKYLEDWAKKYFKEDDISEFEKNYQRVELLNKELNKRKQKAIERGLPDYKKMFYEYLIHDEKIDPEKARDLSMELTQQINLEKSKGN